MNNHPDYSIRFGETVERMFPTEQPIFPFIYTMVPFDNDTWETDKGAATAGNLSGIGPIVPPSTTIIHPVNLESDYAFKLLWIKYSVYVRDASTFAPDVIYRWYENPTGAATWQDDVIDYQRNTGTELTRYLRSTVSFQGSDGRILYGGKNLDAQANLQGDRLPLPVSSVQGYDYGPGQIRSPYFLPRSASIMFELTNTSRSETLVVGAAIYGMKVRF